MAELAVLGSPGPFKAKKKDPEKMLADFELYVKAIKNLMVLTDNADATDAKKKALMQSVGGPDMIWLWDYMGKVLEGDTYQQAIDKVRVAITGQTNQAVMKYKLFQGMPQEDQAFSSWWSKVKEQADKCDFTGYNQKEAARDAILFQTSNTKLRKRILAEDQDLEAVVKLGLAYEQSNTKAKAMGSNDAEGDRIQRLEEEVARFKLKEKKSTKSGQVAGHKKGQLTSRCPTCPDGKRHEGRECFGKKSKECHDCKEPGHFKGAPACKKKKKVRKLKEKKSDAEETEAELSTTDNESIGRVVEAKGETVAFSKESGIKDPMVKVSLKPRLGAASRQVRWLADSGVRRTLLAEPEWMALKKANPGTRLKKNEVSFTPYGTKYKLPVLGRAKVVMTNLKGMKINSMVYVVKGQKESLLGQSDGVRLGILSINPEGSKPGELVHKMTMVKKEPVKKTGMVSGGETQVQIEAKMSKLLGEFKPLFEGIGKARIAPIHIYTKKGRKPVAQKQRTVAHHYLEPLRKHLDELLTGDVIEGPLGSEHASGWVSNVVITGKKYDAGASEEERSKIRVNLDMRLMADVIQTPHFPIPTPEQLRPRFKGSDRFSILDLNHAFHQLEIDEESRKLFVFTTPFGLYRYKRLVMGTPPASAECHSKIEEMLKGLEGVVQIKDDLVIYGEGKQHDERLRRVLQRCMEFGLTFRKEKCKLGQPEVLWFGNVFSKQGMSPDPSKVAIIKEWPAPKDKSEVKSFLQTVQFCSGFMRPESGETYSDVTKPLRELTNHGKRFKWTAECNKSFNKLKELLCSDTVLMSYDPQRFTRLYVDHGPEGVASTVTQRYDVPGKTEPEYRPVAYKSRSLKPAEKGYSKVEGESLGILSGCMENKQYLYGTKFEVVVDHKPLVPLYNSPGRPSPVRVDRHRSKLRGFNFRVRYEPGRATPSDYGSRHPAPDRHHTKQEREELGIEDEDEDLEFSINRVIEDQMPDAVTMETLQKAIKDDRVLSTVVEDVMLGKMSASTRESPYKEVFEELTVADGVLLKGDRLVVPPSLQPMVIALSHEGHGLGETRTISLLRERVWFPRLSRMVKEYVSTCTSCAAAVPGNVPSPIKSGEMPEKPWQTVAADFKGPIGGPRGYYFHLVIDLYSRWPEVSMVKNTSFEKLKPALDKVWSRQGIPEEVIHDGGSPYQSRDWRKYAKRTGFKSVKCTPEHPQANGLAEKFMSTIVKVTHAALAEKKDPKEELQKFLMMYRATPHSSTGKSPSELLLNRKIRIKVPGIIKEPQAKEHKEAKEKHKEERRKQKEYADRHRRAKKKRVLVGDEVLLKQTKTTTKPPWNPQPLKVVKVKGTQVTARHGQFERTRNIEKFKILRKRPEALRVGKTAKRRVKIDTDDEDDDWLVGYGQHRQEVHAAADQEEQGQEQAAHPDDEDDAEDSEEEELNMPAQLQEEVAAQLRNPAVSASGRIRKAPMRYGIDPVEQERAAGDDNKELQLNDSTMSQRTLTPAASPGREAMEDENLSNGFLGSVLPEQPRAATLSAPAPTPTLGAAALAWVQGLPLTGNPHVPLPHTNCSLLMSNLEPLQQRPLSPTVVPLTSLDRDGLWLPMEDVQPGRTAKERAQNVVERHRHWSTGGEGTPRHWRFDTWDPNKQGDKAQTDMRKQKDTS